MPAAAWLGGTRAAVAPQTDSANTTRVDAGLFPL